MRIRGEVMESINGGMLMDRDIGAIVVEVSPTASAPIDYEGRPHMNLGTPPGMSSEVRAIRDSLDHPVIDSDAHIIEYVPDLHDRIRDIAGERVAARFERKYEMIDRTAKMPHDLARRFGVSKTPWWQFPARNTYDRATVTLPRLLYERLPELGIDFAVVYPTFAFLDAPVQEDDELRLATCRAINGHVAATFSGLQDRMVPVATIPMFTPEEALNELRHSIDLGFKAVVMQGWVPRKVPGTRRVYLDTFGLESSYDYDPVWQFCQDHGLAATFHSGSMGMGSRALVGNYMHNHIGHFAESGEGTARGLLFSGVPVRFPKLRFAFLEGGVAWGALLYTSFVSEYEKRNRNSIDQYNPKHMDIDLIRDLTGIYGEGVIKDRIDRLEQALTPLSAHFSEVPDEFAASLIESVDQVRSIFERSFFMGCEGDDRMNLCASDEFGKWIGVRLNAIYGSDIGHWDVFEIQSVLSEAYELVTDGAFSKADFRRMVFDTPVRLWADNNPDFFKGTAIEQAVESHLAQNAIEPDHHEY